MCCLVGGTQGMGDGREGLCLAVQEPTLVLRSTSLMLAARVPGGPQPPDLGFLWTLGASPPLDGSGV